MIDNLKEKASALDKNCLAKATLALVGGFGKFVFSFLLKIQVLVFFSDYL